MRIGILSFVAGVYWLQQQAELPSFHWWPVALSVWIAGTMLARHRNRWLCWSGLAIASTAAMALGIAWAAWIAASRMEQVLPVAWEGRDVEIAGAISGLPTVTDRGTRFEFDIERIATPEAVIPPHIALTWYAETDRKSGAVTPPPEFVPGQRWQLTVRLRRPHGGANPNGFDFEAWALERNIRASGYVRAKNVNKLLPEPAQGIGYRIDAWRDAIRKRFNAVLGDAKYRGVLVALAVGDQNAIPPDQWKTFWRTGVGHLMSISGLHITMVASLAYALAFFAWARLPKLALRLPAQKAASLIGLVAALGYSLIAGFSIPTQRTLYMIAVVSIALFMGRISSASRVLCWALLIVVLADPWAVLAPGFWLSFGAIALIFHVTAGRTGRMGALRGAVLTQIAVTLGMLPMLLALFQEVSLVSPLANAFAIPLISLVVVPVALVAAVVPWDALLHLAHWLLAWCMVPLEWLARTPSAMWESHAPPDWTVALALAGGLLLLAPRGWPGRWTGALWMLPMFCFPLPSPAPGEAWIAVLDVGQGLAAVVRTANHALVYDAGPKWNEDADSGGRIVVPYLRGQGIVKLDGLVVTHDDEDHHGGAIAILDARDVGWLASSLPAESAIVPHAREHRRCAAGTRWEWDGVRFEILNPPAAAYESAGVKDNDLSCVLRIDAGGKSMLLTADVEKRAEAALVAASGAALKSDVLLVPHHGSKTSSTQVFIDAVAPGLAVLPVGYRNRFRHPHPDVMARYQAGRVRVLRTDLHGAVTVKLSAEGIAAEAERMRRRRYWQDAPQRETPPD